MRTTSLVLVLAAMGCGTEPAPLGVSYGPYGCPPAVCGGNSGEVPRNGMHEANLFGEPDVHAISLETAYSDTFGAQRAQIWDASGKSYDLYVRDGRISGVSPNDFVISGVNLVGAHLRVLRKGVPLYNIRIDGVRTIPTPVGKPDPVEIYVMTWVPLDGTKPGDLCEVPAQPFNDSRDQDQLLGMLSNETLVYEGDRIDADAKTMNENDRWDANWFNFGCAGRTLAKLRLLRKTQGNGTGSWKARQSALKMLSADYCGNGHSFTRTGTHIGWKDAEGLVDYVFPPRELEARWDERGAICLDTTRLPNTPDYVHNECLPLSCAELDMMPVDFQDLRGAQIISALYD